MKMLSSKTKSIARYLAVVAIFAVAVGYFLRTKIPEPEISIALFNAPASAALVKLVPEFEKETGIRVSVELLPYADLKAKIEQQVLTKSGTYDVIMADCIWIPSFASRGFLSPVDTKVAGADYDFDDLLPSLDDYLGRYPKGGTRFGVPFMSNTQMMAYRPSIVEPVANRLKIGMPGDSPETAWTWEQYLAVAKEISSLHEGDHPRIYGTSLQARAGAWIVYEWYSELFGFVDDQNARLTGLPKFDVRASQAMDYYASLYKAAPAEALTWGHEEETAAMCSGKTAMDATSNVELAANLLKPECMKNGRLAFAYPPVGVSGRGSPDMGGYGLLLTRDSKRIEDASRFILWATSKNVHKHIVLQGGSPIRRSELNDPDVLKAQPYLHLYETLIRDSVYRARIPEWPELQDIISRELTSVMKGENSGSVGAAAVQRWVEDQRIHP